jgi:hypothetical protein
MSPATQPAFREASGQHEIADSVAAPVADGGIALAGV